MSGSTAGLQLAEPPGPYFEPCLVVSYFFCLPAGPRIPAFFVFLSTLFPESFSTPNFGLGQRTDLSFQLPLTFLKTRKKIFFFTRTRGILRTGKTSKIQKSYSFLMVFIPGHHPFQVPKQGFPEPSWHFCLLFLAWNQTPSIPLPPLWVSSTSYHLPAELVLWARHRGEHFRRASHVILVSPLREVPIPSSQTPSTKEETWGWRDKVTCLNSHGQSVAAEGLEVGLPDPEALLSTSTHCPPVDLCFRKSFPSTEAQRHRMTRTNKGVLEEYSGPQRDTGRPLAPPMTTGLSDFNLDVWQRMLSSQHTEGKL